MILSGRLLLLLAVAGAFVLAVMAMQAASYTALGTLALYASFTIIPLAVINYRSKT